MAKPGILVFHTTTGEAQKTLVTALRNWLRDNSWGQVRRLVQSRRVQINGNLCIDEGRRLQEGDVVRVLPHPQAPPPRDDDVRIHFVDSYVVVVEKPAGMTTIRHPEEREWPSSRKDRRPTLDEVLPRVLEKKMQGRKAASRKATARGSRPRVRAVHRLDRDTSGLIVFARSIDAERDLVQQFRQHTIHRKYLAIVHGEVRGQTFDSFLVRDRGDGRRGTAKTEGDGQRAVTHVRLIEKLGAYSLVECRLETGRTHQIRIHLSEAGHFVCGDKVYCQPLFKKPIDDRSGAPRLALHAAELGFCHPETRENLLFKMPLPPDLKELLNRLRRES